MPSSAAKVASPCLKAAAHMHAQAAGAATDVAVEPVYVSTDIGHLFGWLHLPLRERISDLGVLICKPFGYEGLCAHRSLRAFAQMTAAVGAPTLTFDYLDTGDSADLETDADQLEQWCADIVSAAAMLRRTAGVERVCLLGFRLGALVATLASHRTSIDGLVLVAPVISGAAYLRELRTVQALAERRMAPDHRGADDGALDVNGYRLSAASIRTLGTLDLTKVSPPPVSTLLVVDRGGGLPATSKWMSSLTARGVQAEYTSLPGAVEMMMVFPHETRIPHTMIEGVRAWLQKLATPREGVRVQLQIETIECMPLLIPHAVSNSAEIAATAMERPVHFGPEDRLFGIVTEPYPREKALRAVVLVNAGAESHVGMGRVYVELARAWVQRGCVTLRMDLGGLGDSKAAPGRPDNEAYPPGAVEELRSAVEFLRLRYGVSDVSLGGLCSGGYHAFRAAAAAVPVNRIFMVNPETFLWQEEAVYAADIVRAPGVLRDRFGSLDQWIRLLTGRIDMVRQLRLLGHRMLLSLSAWTRQALALLHIRLANDLDRKFEELAGRGVEVTMVFAPDEPGLKLLHLQAASTVRRLPAGFRLHIVDGADHMFTRRHARVALQGLLSAMWHGGVVEPAASAAARDQ